MKRRFNFYSKIVKMLSLNQNRSIYKKYHFDLDRIATFVRLRGFGDYN